MSDYPLISDHGLIGDLQTSALVTKDGTIDFFCAPRFDSPSIFASLLDARKGGSFRVAPRLDDYTTTQMYFPQSACLITRFMTDAGVGELVDFMPIDNPTVATDNHKIARGVRCLRGQMPFRLECEPRFDFARQTHELSITSEGALFQANGQEVVLHGAAGAERSGDGDVRLDFTLQAGEVRGFMLETGATRAPQPMNPAEAIELFEQTVRYWRSWLSRCTYQGRWREMVHRSAMALKLMTYAPTGALVAATTTGLPEQVGGERNWDYRFTWIRDASFSVYALLAWATPRRRGPFSSGSRVASWKAPERRPARSRPCTGWMGPRIWPRSPWIIWRATWAPARYGSATGRPTSSSSTSTARSWTRSP